jgi:Rha family phage regulatory protein
MENNIIDVRIENIDGKLYANSRDIAEKLGKRHDNICSKIREVLTLLEFKEREFITEQGNKYTEYLLDRDAFVLLLMNYTGYNDFKRAYIKKFSEMEEYIKNQQKAQEETIDDDSDLVYIRDDRVLTSSLYYYQLMK